MNPLSLRLIRKYRKQQGIVILSKIILSIFSIPFILCCISILLASPGKYGNIPVETWLLKNPIWFIPSILLGLTGIFIHVKLKKYNTKTVFGILLFLENRIEEHWKGSNTVNVIQLKDINNIIFRYTNQRNIIQKSDTEMNWITISGIYHELYSQFSFESNEVEILDRMDQYAKNGIKVEKDSFYV